jgi:hypothetical protein
LKEHGNQRKNKMTKKDNMKYLDIVKGVEGLSVYIDDYRVLGNKPWGGGTISRSYELSNETIKEIIEKLQNCLQPKEKQNERDN